MHGVGAGASRRARWLRGAAKGRALLDKDLDDRGDEILKVLPVSMIENLLVDPDVIFEAIESVADRTGLHTIEEVTLAFGSTIRG